MIAVGLAALECARGAAVTDMVRTTAAYYLDRHWTKIKASLLDGSYEPMPARRKEIEKLDGGMRLLGIPTVLDRLVQQGIAQILEKIWDHTFSESSYGFRPKRSQRDAMTQCREHVASGLRICVDIDLSKFFDRVNHDRLMSRLATKITDKRVLKLIRKYLECGVMIDGLEEPTREGTPQGGPLSPLLSNIVLDELDKELEKRALKFVRYADDCVVYVGSKRAGERVKGSITKFITKRLRLKVNEAKSSVGRPWKSKYLGFSLTNRRENPRIKLHWKSRDRLKAKIRELTKRHEQQVGPTVIAALSHFREHSPQGEFTLVLGGAPQQQEASMSDDQCRQRLATLIDQGMKPSDAAKDLARSSGRSRRELYALMHVEEKEAD